MEEVSTVAAMTGTSARAPKKKERSMMVWFFVRCNTADGIIIISSIGQKPEYVCD